MGVAMRDDDPVTATGLASELWPALCERLGALGAELARPPYPTGERAAVDGIRYLSRIVTLHNMTLSTGRDLSGVLTMEATARTYRYLDPVEIEEVRRTAVKQKPGAKP